LERFIKGVSIAIQADPNVASIVVGGLLIVIQSALRFTTYFDKLADMLQKFGDYLEPLVEYAKIQHPSIHNCTVSVYDDLLRFYQEACDLFVGPGGENRTAFQVSSHTFLRSQWEPFESRFGTIEQNFQHHLSVLSHASGAVKFNTLQDFKENAEMYQSYARERQTRSSTLFVVLRASTNLRQVRHMKSSLVGSLQITSKGRTSKTPEKGSQRPVTGLLSDLSLRNGPRLPGQQLCGVEGSVSLIYFAFFILMLTLS
jgi:hypothetical protein